MATGPLSDDRLGAGRLSPAPNRLAATGISATITAHWFVGDPTPQELEEFFRLDEVALEFARP